MSEYINVLRRLDAESQGPRREDGVRRPPPQPEELPEVLPVAAPHELRRVPETDRWEATQAPRDAYARIYENIRAVCPNGQFRCLVIAGTEQGDPVPALARGLAVHMQRQGLSVQRAAVSEMEGRPVLCRVAELPAGAPENPQPLPLDLRSASASGALAEWLDRNERGADVMLIEGAPIADSIDSLMLAQGCDGLVLTATIGSTPAESLRGAAERIRLVGGRVLGMVLCRPPDGVPPWLRRLLEQPHPLWRKKEAS